MRNGEKDRQRPNSNAEHKKIKTRGAGGQGKTWVLQFLMKIGGSYGEEIGMGLKGTPSGTAREMGEVNSQWVSYKVDGSVRGKRGRGLFEKYTKEFQGKTTGLTLMGQGRQRRPRLAADGIEPGGIPFASDWGRPLEGEG